MESNDESLKGSHKEKSVIKTMTVSVQPMYEEFTTITEKVKEKLAKLITKNYFVTKGQRVNKDMNRIDPNWETLKSKVNKMIDSALKEEMVVEAYRIKLKYVEKDQKVIVQNFYKIGKSY